MVQPRWHCEHAVGDEELLIPVQNQGPWKMASYLDRRHTLQHRLCLPIDQLTSIIMGSTISTVNPFLVFGRNVHWTVEHLRPVKVGGIVVWMADHYRLQTASGFDRLDRLVVKIRDAVPEYVAFGRLKKDAALADGELGLSADGPYARIIIVWSPLVGIVAEHFS